MKWLNFASATSVIVLFIVVPTMLASRMDRPTPEQQGADIKRCAANGMGFVIGWNGGITCTYKAKEDCK